MIPALEFLAVLLAARTWAAAIRDALNEHVQVAVRTDSAAAMGAALTCRSPAPLLNDVAKELAADAAAGLFVVDHFFNVFIGVVLRYPLLNVLQFFVEFIYDFI